MIGIDSVTEKKYWKLQNMIPKDKRSLPIRGNFQTKLLHPWLCYTGFIDMALLRKFDVLRPSEWFEIEVFDLQNLGKFDVWARAGIVRKSGKEIVVSNTQAIVSPKEFIAVIQLIRRSELEKIMHTYKDLILDVIHSSG